MRRLWSIRNSACAASRSCSTPGVTPALRPPEAGMAIERIEVFVTELPARLQRTFSSGSWDTGPAGQILGKPVLVKIHADGVTGVAQIRSIAPGHFLPDTPQSMVAAITEVFG